MDEENAYLTLGCFGRTENGFVLCPSVQNRILKLDTSLVHYTEIMDYFDAVKLFDRPILDQNAIRHIVYNCQERYDQKVKRLWSDHQYSLFERFMHSHKPCGLFLRIILTAEKQAEFEPEHISFVVKASSQHPPAPTINHNMQKLRRK